MRSGDEPRNARSPLRLRLVLAWFGIAASLAGVVVFVLTGDTPLVVVFAVCGVVTLGDLLLVRHRIAQGAHYQPGLTVPPYRPAQDDTPRPARPAREVAEATRMRRYFALMGTCLLLICLAWFWVRTFSTGLAVAMSVVAAFIPPVASFLANTGVRLPDEPPPPRAEDEP